MFTTKRVTIVDNVADLVLMSFNDLIVFFYKYQKLFSTKHASREKSADSFCSSDCHSFSGFALMIT